MQFTEAIGVQFTEAVTKAIGIQVTEVTGVHTIEAVGVYIAEAGVQDIGTCYRGCMCTARSQLNAAGVQVTQAIAV